jgi:isocitrate/isopropylmalate dehydrogenase
MREPHAFDLLVFREHTEDCYSELEWKKGSPEAKQLIGFLNADLAKKLNKSGAPRLQRRHQAHQRHRHQAAHPAGPGVRHQAPAKSPSRSSTRAR